MLRSTSLGSASRRKALLPLLILVLAIVVPMASTAGSAVGSFEIDGNTPDDSGPGEPIDWETPPPNLIPFTDGTGNTDDTFSGSKENEPDESPAKAWDFVINGAPGKADILSGAIASRLVSGQVFAYVNFTRAATSGNTFANFEFNQLNETFVNQKGETIPKRKAGDLIVAYFVTNGGAELGVKVGTWVGDHHSGFWDLDAGTLGSDFDAAVNVAGAWNFAEASVNLSAFGINLGCPGFGQGWIKTTSSDTFESAALQDFTARHPLNLSNCAQKTFSFTFDPKPISGTKVFAVYTPANSSEKTVELTDPDTDGTYTATDATIPPGTMTFHFEVRANNDNDPDYETLVWRSDHDLNTAGNQDGSETLAAFEQKTNPGSLAYEVLLTPAAAENFTGKNHTLTATVREKITLVPLDGVTVNFATTPCGTLNPTSAVTNSNGQATTILSSATPCSATITAFVDGVGGTEGVKDTGEAAGTATKKFVTYTLTVTPPGQINVAPSDHTFLVTLLKDEGTGNMPVSGAIVDLQITGDAGFVSIDGQPASGKTGQCTTNASGQCSAVIHGNSPGQVTLGASFTTQNDSGQGTFTGTGDKQFVNYQISVTPANATNEVGDPHTFTVLLEKDTGGGFQPIAGKVVTLSLAPGTSNATITSVNGGAPGGPPITCTTRTSPAGTCEVIVSATTPGSVVLTATFEETLDSGPLTRSGTGNKLFSDFELTITPENAVNEVGEDHTFIVTLRRNDGGGFAGYVGQTVNLTFDPGTTGATIESINGAAPGDPPYSCVTQGPGGTCTVVVNSTEPGAVQLSASWSETFNATSSASRSDSADKAYIEVTLTKNSCPTDRTTPGGHVDFTLRVTVAGTSLTGAVLTDDLPVEFVFESASPTPDSAPSPGDNNGQVAWNLGNLPDGYDQTFTISGHIDEDTSGDPPGTNVTNTATLEGNEITDKVRPDDVLVTTEGAAADGRAFGLEASLLGGLLTQGATPDTDVAGENPGEELGVHALAPTLDAGLLQVENTSSVTDLEASDAAVATTANVSIDLPGVTVEAKSVVARSSSTATATTAGSSRDGSKVQDLVVNGTTYGDIAEPTTIVVTDPVSGDPVAEVRVLERIGSGAAAGVSQPDAGLFSSDMTVNGIHVIVYDQAATPFDPTLGVLDESSEIIVSHAHSEASFPSGLACGVELERVFGDAYLVNVFNPVPDAGSVMLGLVTLPVTGGEDTAKVLDTTPLGAMTGFTHTEGTLDPLEAFSEAQVNGLDILGGTITATLIRATSDTGPAAGDTIIADLEIAGTDVCDTLGAGSTCMPGVDTPIEIDEDGDPVTPPTLLVLLNEQIDTPTGLRVNAVHIFVIGAGNPLGLPVGAEIIISSAFAGTS